MMSGHLTKCPFTSTIVGPKNATQQSFMEQKVMNACLRVSLGGLFRENLERLLDDKHFKEEIVHFNISEETGVVEAPHRGKLIPVLMR